MYFTVERRTGGYRAYLKGANHEIVFNTETYTTKQSALHAISLAQGTSVRTPIHDLT